jgi:cytochrome P450
MVLHPDVQQKAFEEIRSVCGPDRLPSYDEDRENLPYLSATIMENFRWAPATPLGIYLCFSYHLMFSDGPYSYTAQKCR